MSSAIVEGDCLAVMATMDADSVDAIITDPPYHLTSGKKGGSGAASLNPDHPAGRSRIGTGFMGKAWDGGDVAFRAETWEAALRVAKPGAYLVAFGGTRTFHRLACAIEDAGWEIRDCLSWLYGSGFPKSLDVAKEMDKRAGHWRGRANAIESNNGSMSGPNYGRTDKGSPITIDARTWAGWGTALKPAWEPIILARKPLIGTVAANVTEYGTGAINIDACRIPAEKMVGYNGKMNRGSFGGFPNPNPNPNPARWPANVCLDEEAAALLDEQSGTCESKPFQSATGVGVSGYMGGLDSYTGRGFSDKGGASRFYYTAKASRSEREAGMIGEEKPLLWSAGKKNPGAFQSENTNRSARNNHPTVKPLSLMRWLVTLVTPPQGLILDPFAGSGTTGCAAVLGGFRFVGIEREAEYAEIARARTLHAESRYQPELGLLPGTVR